jgi:hypothetical protein
VKSVVAVANCDAKTQFCFKNSIFEKAPQELRFLNVLFAQF